MFMNVTLHYEWYLKILLKLRKVLQLGNRSSQLQKKHMTLMSSEPEPAIWSRDTGHQIPLFDRCRLTITWMSIIKALHVCCKLRLHASAKLLAGEWLPMLHDVIVAGWKPMIHAASHVDHKKVLWFSISMHACGSVPLVRVLRYHVVL